MRDKKFTSFPAFIIIAVLFGCGVGHAQAAAERIVPDSKPTSSSTVALALPATKTSLSDVVLANDKLSIRVFREPEISAEWNNGNSVGYSVDSLGNLSFPMIGTIYVQGLTLEQLRKKLTALLEEYFVNPEVNLSFYDKKIKQQVAIMGQIVKSGNFEYTNGMSIVRLIAEAGGFLRTSETTDGTRRSILPDAAHVQITRLAGAPGGRAQVVDVQAIMDGRAPDVQLEPSDLVVVPIVSVIDEKSNALIETVSVLGQVNQPGNFELAGSGTLIRAISDAHGFTRYASQNEVLLTRKTPSEQFTKRVNVSAIMNGRAEDIPLQAGDMIFVPESEF